MTPSGWRVFAASAIGKNHLDTGLPCQDAFAYRLIGTTLVALVCDGAGSARRSELGAATCARQMVDRIAVRLESGVAPGALDAAAFAADVGAVRATLESLAIDNALELRDLACTLVGAVLDTAGGYLFHIGDGLGIVEISDKPPTISSPENGEYANETWFITGDDWRDNLRIIPVPAGANCVALMSDGAMPFVMNREHSGLFPGFIDPVRRYLAGVDETEGSEGLQSTLADERTWSITGDDKTLLLALAG
jgi:hypothetical protein